MADVSEHAKLILIVKIKSCMDAGYSEEDIINHFNKKYPKDLILELIQIIRIAKFCGMSEK